MTGCALFLYDNVVKSLFDEKSAILSQTELLCGNDKTK